MVLAWLLRSCYLCSSLRFHPGTCAFLDGSYTSLRHSNRQDIQSAAVHKSHAYKKLASTTRRSSSFYTIHVSALYHCPHALNIRLPKAQVGITKVRPNNRRRYAFKARLLLTLHTRHLRHAHLIRNQGILGCPGCRAANKWSVGATSWRLLVFSSSGAGDC